MEDSRRHVRGGVRAMGAAIAIVIALACTVIEKVQLRASGWTGVTVLPVENGPATSSQIAFQRRVQNTAGKPLRVHVWLKPFNNGTHYPSGECEASVAAPG